MNTLQNTVQLKASITGTVAAQEMKLNNNSQFSFGSPGIEAGGRIVLGTATTAKVLVTDQTGKVLHSAASAVTSNTDIDPIPAGVQGPLLVTVTEISNSAHTLTVYWTVRR